MADGAYIDGKWQAGQGERLEARNPASGELNWKGSIASDNQVADAVASARNAFPDFANLSTANRVAMMERWADAIRDHADEIALTITADVGKPHWEAKTEAGAMAGKIAHSIRAQSERAGTIANDGGQLLTHRPHGVMAVFGPFNFPGHLPNGHIVPALLAGNTVVFKPSEHAPNTGALFARLADAAGLPKGVLNIVQGGRDTGAALLDQDINGVLFTGSAKAGLYFHKLFAGRPDVILALEMGGNNPLIIHDANDIDAAVDIAVVSAFISAGQRCSCARRLILPKDNFGDAVIERIQARMAELTVGDPMTDVFMGTVVDAKQVETALAFEADLVARGGVSLVPFARPDGDGAYLRPALIDMTKATDVADDELFAPLLQIFRVSSGSGAIDAMIAHANATQYGLAAGLVSDDAALWDYTRPRLRAGIVNWNKPTTGAASSMPFGGPGHSGNFRPGAYYAADYCAWPQASQTAVAPASPSLPNF